MASDPLKLTLTGAVADAVRAIAAGAGLSPQEWLHRALQPLIPDAPVGQPDAARSGAGEAVSDSTMDPVAALSRPEGWEVVTEPNGIFSVALPRGWKHQVAVVPTPAGPTRLFNAQSPDGGTTIFGNDPEVQNRKTGLLGMLSGRGAPRGEAFASEYLTHRYGRQPGFRILGTKPSPQLERELQRASQASGVAFTWLDAVEISAQYQQNGQQMTVAALVGAFQMPMIWGAQVTQVTSTGDASAYLPACLDMLASFQLLQAGQQMVQDQRRSIHQQHEQVMGSIAANTAAMKAGHEQRMQGIAAQGAAFQASMQERQEAFDAGVQSWRTQQAAADQSHSRFMSGVREQPSYGAAAGAPNEHRNFLNTMKEQETVVDSDGWEHQVEAGPDKYFYNKHEERFIGLRNHEDIHDVPGIDPDDWDETPIQR